MKAIRVKKFNYPLPIPVYTERSEFEMEKILHRWKVVARKNQIKAQMLDQDIPFQPLGIPQYQTPKRRINLLKVVIKYLRLLLP